MQEQRPVPSKTFYGAVDPSTSLKVMKGAPTLKGAFAARLPEDAAEQICKEHPSKKQNCGKSCTAHFGCRNLAVFTEDSGTLYCRDHKPTNVPTKAIAVDKQHAKSSKKK